MRHTRLPNRSLVAIFVLLLGGGLPIAPPAKAQEPASKADLAAVADLVRQLQTQVQTLSAQVQDLQSQRRTAQVENAAMRRELDTAKLQIASLEKSPTANPVAVSNQPPQTQPAYGLDDRLSRMDESIQLEDSKISEQSQTKIESGSKYRLRLSGIVLFNTFLNRGAVDNVDFPQLAIPAPDLSSNNSFGASLRQSEIGLDAFGPTIAGARTSASLRFDFAGGFSNASNGVTFGAMRLRTGTIRLDWQDTSLVAGQDALFFSPLSPSSIATLAEPALSYSGNLWGWTPQIRVEHRFHIAERSTLSLQGGILDSLTGEPPLSSFYRSPTWGENSGQPAYATRIAWTQNIAGQNFIFGAGSYYGRQNWGYGRGIDGWSGMADATVPLGQKFEFTGQFYRGRAVGGLSGGIGQSVLWYGSLADPATKLTGLDSIGAWAQLKFKATTKLQLNAAFGQDNPFANELRQYGGNFTQYGAPLSKNQTGLFNFIYQPRSDVILSLEYRKIRTYILDSNSNSANVVNFSLGYIF